METLPDEILVEILKYLPPKDIHKVCSQINQRVRRLTKCHFDCIAKLTLGGEDNAILKKFHKYLSVHKPYIQCLELTTLQIKDKYLLTTLLAILRILPCLKALTVEGEINLLWKKSHNQEHAIMGQNKETAWSLFQATLCQMSDLQKLDLKRLVWREADFERLTRPWSEHDMNNLVTSCPRIEAISINICSFRALNRILEERDSLKKRLAIFDVEDFQWSYNTETKWYLVHGFKRLTHLSAMKLGEYFWTMLPSLNNLSSLKLLNLTESDVVHFLKAAHSVSAPIAHLHVKMGSLFFSEPFDRICNKSHYWACFPKVYDTALVVQNLSHFCL